MSDRRAIEIVNGFLEKNGIEYSFDKFIRENLQDNSMVCRYIIEGTVYYTKIFRNKCIKQLNMEVSFMQHLLISGICVPKLLEMNSHYIFEVCDEPDKVAFIFMTELLGDAMIDEGTLQDTVINVANIHAISSNFSIKEYDAEGNSDFRQLRDFVRANTSIVSELCDIRKILFLLDQKEPQRNYHCIHADLHMANIVLRNGKFFGLIDFTDCKIGLFEDDLGKLFQNYLTGELCDIRMVKELIDVYQNATDYCIDVKEVYISCIYRILYNFQCLSKICSDSQLRVIQARYSMVIDSCIREVMKI